ncbi:hypothetical protein ACWV95_06830 [Streptomyces albus]
MLKPMEHFAPPTGQHPGPSRIDAVVSGELSWTEVDLVDLAGGETEALRSVLETYGVRVNRFPVGQPRHLVAALGGVRQAAPYVVLSCHGADGGILLDELIPEVAGTSRSWDRPAPTRSAPICGSRAASSSPPGATPVPERWPTRSSTRAAAPIWHRRASPSGMRRCSPFCTCSTN